MNASFRVGATLVLQPRFDAAAALGLMVREGVTRFLGVPTCTSSCCGPLPPPRGYRG